MEPHPIPQNVTTFQFHLVGDMTLKQFMYLATGSVIAYILFVFLAPIYPIVAWPGIVISASTGAAFAFLPIGSRPLDHWLGAFLRAVYSPTKRVWKKNDQTYKDDPLFSSRLVAYLASLPASQRLASPLARGEQPRVPQNLRTTQSISVSQPTPPPTLPTTDELGKAVDLARQAQNLQLRIIQTERTLNQIKSEASQPTSIPIDYSQQVNKIIVDLQSLITQASQIRQQLDTVTKPQQPTPQVAISPARLQEKVKVVIPTKPKQTQLALTTFPNVISGIVKDTAGNYLEGCIAVIYDKEGLPVRALKTNKLGQFTGSTPLPNGTYKLVIEKDNFNFDILQIELAGELLPPLLITAKPPTVN